jgi:hypothetical protein
MGLPDVSKREELVELAMQEGHDADIPSNEGFISPNSPTFTLDNDIEKDAGKEISIRTRSRTSLDSAPEDPGEQQNVVWWDGENDPQNPMNWPSFRSWSLITIVSMVTFLTPLGSSIFAPAVPLVMDDFDSTNELLSGFVVSVYVLGFAFGPLGW